MEVIKVFLGPFLVLCSLAQADNLKVVDALPKDQDSTEMKIEMILTVLADQKDKISNLEEIVQRQELKIAELESIIDEPSKTNSAIRFFDKESKAAMYRSCEELRSADPGSGSGGYWIDPDGVATGDPPIYVLCNMTTGSTLVSHNSEESIQVDRCLDPGCYSRSVTYNATMRQMVALTQLSQSCRQFFKFDCLGVPFEFNNVADAWWNDRDGVPRYHWAGSNQSVHTCQCGIDGNCVLSDLNCNCDALAVAQLYDEGYITSKDALPVTRLNFGRTLAINSYGIHTLGKLECSGRATVNKMPESCDDLWKIGHTLNGFYDVKGDKQVRSVYCDFTKIPGDPGVETAVGVVDVKSSPVYFHVQRNSAYTLNGTTIPFDIERLNVGGGMNITSGIFTAPKSGIYFFSFTGIKTTATSSLYIYLYHNSNRITVAYAAPDSFPLTFTFSSTLSLRSGDQISLLLHAGQLSDTLDRHTNFNGILLQEEIFS